MEKSFRITTGEILYWLFFGTLLLAKGLGFYDGQFVFLLILVFATLCLFIKILIEKYTISEFIKIFVIMLVTGMTYVLSGEKGLLLYGMMMIGMKYVNVKNLFKIGALIWGAAFTFIVIFSSFHMEDTVYKIHEKLGMGHIFRWSLGYPHPNVLQISYIVLAIFVIYLLGKGFNWKHACLLFLGNCIVFLYSVSYTGFIVFMVLLLGRIYLMLRRKFNLLEKILIQLIYPSCVLISLVLPRKGYGKLFLFLNKVLSSRMELANMYLKPEYISLFGRRLSEITTETLTMDNAYLYGYITYGVIPFLILSVFSVFMIYMMTKREQYLELVIVIAIAIGGLTEPFLYNTSFKNLSFIFMGTLLFHGQTNGKERMLLPGLHLQKWNRTFELKNDKWDNFEHKLKEVFSFSLVKLLFAIGCGMIVAVTAEAVITYPKGYVVYRADCSDLEKVFHHYGEENEKYPDYKEMGEFQQGELVEYFGGNIVLMERIRDTIRFLLLGFGMGYFIYSIILQGRIGETGNDKEAK